MSRWPAKEAMQERILDTAGRLFYGQGIRAVGRRYHRRGNRHQQAHALQTIFRRRTS